MVSLADCIGVFLVVTVLKLLCALRIDLYHSTDFDVHRNWLAVTHQEPIEKWYYEETSEWTLDYPPFFAYFEYYLSKIAAKVDPLLVRISKEPLSNKNVVLFQKASVMITDIVMVFGTYAFGNALEIKENKCSLYVGLLLGNFGLFLVDHLHFQYNGMLMGLLLLFLAALICKKYKTSAVVFTIMLNFKHLFLYVAPFVGISMLQAANKLRIEKGAIPALKMLIYLGIIVLSITFVSFGAFVSQLSQLQARLFPFTRGLTHSYWAGNVWALYNLLDWLICRLTGQKSSLTAGLVGEFTHKMLPAIDPKLCAVLTLISMLPALYTTFTKPTRQNLLLSYCSCALSSFLFGWHVHEKAILLVILPLSGLLFLDENRFFRPFIFLTVAGHSGLLPLIFTQFEQVIVIGLYFLSTLTVLYIQKENFKQLYSLEKMYVSSTFVISAYVQIWSHLLHPTFPFLSLIIQSTYSAIGILYTFIILNFHMLSPEKLKVQ